MTEAYTDNPWTINGEKTVFENPWMRVAEYDAVNITGAEADYGIVHFKNRGVGIVPYEDGYVWMVGQYRLATGDYSWEIPAGGGPKDEPAVETARRELKEETGLTAQNYERIITAHLSNSITDEYAEIYLATDLTPGQWAPEDTENLQVKKMSLDEVYAEIESGSITDSPTIMAIYKLMLLKSQGRL